MSKGGNEEQIWTWLGWKEGLSFYKGRGYRGKEETMPQAGQLLFFRPKEKIFWGLGGEKDRDYPAHVAISLGDDDAMSLWNKPNNIDHIQRIKVKDIEGIVQIGRPITTLINSSESPWKE
ncbi:hypothetical protein [Nostoc sp.]|uniref:hypothetical protein n=1 Tax=Nostoc sp. TaxID=1180 RepID=UPI002FF3BB04